MQRRVSASTQNQALIALLFWYRDVLHVDIGPIEHVPRARTPVRLPVVLSREEIGRILRQVDGVMWIVVALLYGCGAPYPAAYGCEQERTVYLKRRATERFASCRNSRFRSSRTATFDANVHRVAARIAFFTLGVLKAPVGDGVVQGFVDRLASVYAAAEGSAGFFARSIRNVQTWEHSWGPVLAPKCVPADLGLNQLAMTLSLWRDLESVAAYAYRGVHAEALSKRGDWFERGSWPSFVAWWVEEQHQPNWAEAVERIDRLHAQGSTPAAFNFRQPFDSAGKTTKLNRALVGP